MTKDTGWSKGDVVQTMDYYPFGAEFCDKNTKNFVQNHKYNGKEFDHMHGLNTYDYGARQYNPVTGRWDRMDPLCEDYYPYSPYNYCLNNPVKNIDPDGRIVANVLGALAGGSIEFASQMLQGKSLKDVSWAKVGVSAVEGGLTSGASVGRKIAVTVGVAIINSSLDGNSGQDFVSGAVGNCISAVGGKAAGKAASLLKTGISNKIVSNIPSTNKMTKMVKAAHPEMNGKKARTIAKQLIKDQKNVTKAVRENVRNLKSAVTEKVTSEAMNKSRKDWQEASRKGH